MISEKLVFKTKDFVNTVPDDQGSKTDWYIPSMWTLDFEVWTADQTCGPFLKSILWRHSISTTMSTKISIDKIKAFSGSYWSSSKDSHLSGPAQEH